MRGLDAGAAQRACRHGDGARFLGAFCRATLRLEQGQQVLLRCRLLHQPDARPRYSRRPDTDDRPAADRLARVRRGRGHDASWQRQGAPPRRACSREDIAHARRHRRRSRRCSWSSIAAAARVAAVEKLPGRRRDASSASPTTCATSRRRRWSPRCGTACGVALLSTAIVVPLAFALRLCADAHRAAGQTAVLRALALLPLFAPSLLPAISLIYMFGNQGFLKSWLVGGTHLWPHRASSWRRSSTASRMP